MEIAIAKVEGYNRKSMPKENETIEEDIDLDKLVPFATQVMVYRRDKKDCPKNRGNVVIDIVLRDNKMFYLKLPIEMTDEHVMKFIKPLMDKLEAYKRSIMN
jgi:formamidopyrimidine-DNA glycosylase